ncbi:hypothetical protein CYMTET_32941 [Cymbomonas tetramitiformis]|uniref:Uncharacterized protein n=1 Tax=Cymbomonas tetramitiformis TaxID=36881 RepID=A0AAE0FDV9_9CHLO|nr:hypothetical protein CYMTET_32941 [Cymbomonas tetramitiformis]
MGDALLPRSDDAVVASLIDEDDLAPLVRAAFERGKPDEVVSSLRNLAQDREREVEELCRVYYEDFVHSLGRLQKSRSIAGDIKSKVAATYVWHLLSKN